MRISILPEREPAAARPPAFRPGFTMRRGLIAIALSALCAGPIAASAQEKLRPFVVTDDSIPASLTGERGDPARGRAIVINRQYTCLLCHSGPFPNERFQGDLSPDLNGAGARWSEGQLRLRLVDASRLNPDTIMPSYYKIDGLTRVGANWKDKPILTAAQIEDVVAYLATLRD